MNRKMDYFDYFGTCRSTKGFTLMELLLAIFIFGLVISAVYGVYHATFLVVNHTGDKMAVAGRARVALERINEDLFSLFPGKAGFLSGEHHEDLGMDSDRLSFYSTLHISFKKGEKGSGMALIEYFAEEDGTTGLLNLYRSDRILLPGIGLDKEKRRKYLLCDRLTGVRFLYYDVDGGQHDEWRSDGEHTVDDDKNRFPALVSVVLSFGKSVDSDDVTVFTTAVALQRKK
ncbi:PulJ/GspJ family protein [Desulfomarina sp.]